jgi:hypothetical protein
MEMFSTVVAHIAFYGVILIFMLVLADIIINRPKTEWDKYIQSHRKYSAPKIYTLLAIWVISGVYLYG